MSARVGEAAPDFRAVSDDGRRIELSGLRGRWVILFFFPRAGTPGCSVEARAFESLAGRFEQLGAVPVGVSTDTEAAHAKFRDRCGLSYPLLPDGERRLARAFGTLGLFGMARRQTFLIDPQGRVARHWSSVNPAGHARQVLEEIEHLQRRD